VQQFSLFFAFIFPPSYPQILAGWRRLLPLAGIGRLCRVAKLNNNVYLCGIKY